MQVPNTTAAYIDFLAAMCRSHASLTRVLGQTQVDQVERLRADLRDLRAATPLTLTFDHDGGELGVRYVVLGSHFGNKSMLASIKAALPDVPTRFLSGDGLESERWKAFKATLLNVDPQANDLHVSAAVATFRHFERGFREPKMRA